MIQCAKERLYGKIEEQAKNLSKPDEERSKLAKPVSLEFVTSGRSGHESCVTGEQYHSLRCCN